MTSGAETREWCGICSGTGVIYYCAECGPDEPYDGHPSKQIVGKPCPNNCSPPPKRLIRLSYSGHYPDKFRMVTQEEYERLQELSSKSYLCDTKEGRDMIAELEAREPADFTMPPTFVAYY